MLEQHIFLVRTSVECVWLSDLRWGGHRLIFGRQRLGDSQGLTVCLASHAVPSSLIALGQHLLWPEMLLASTDVLFHSSLRLDVFPMGSSHIFCHCWCGSRCGVHARQQRAEEQWGWSQSALWCPRFCKTVPKIVTFQWQHSSCRALGFCGKEAGPNCTEISIHVPASWNSWKYQWIPFPGCAWQGWLTPVSSRAGGVLSDHWGPTEPAALRQLHCGEPWEREEGHGHQTAAGGGTWAVGREDWAFLWALAYTVIQLDGMLDNLI